MTDPNETDVTPEERIDALEAHVAELVAVVARWWRGGGAVVARLELARLDEAGDRFCRDPPRTGGRRRVLVDCEGNGEG